MLRTNKVKVNAKSGNSVVLTATLAATALLLHKQSLGSIRRQQCHHSEAGAHDVFGIIRPVICRWDGDKEEDEDQLDQDRPWLDDYEAGMPVCYPRVDNHPEKMVGEHEP